MHKELKWKKKEVEKQAEFVIKGVKKSKPGGSKLLFRPAAPPAYLRNRLCLCILSMFLSFFSLLINLPNVLFQTAEVAGLTCLFIPSPAEHSCCWRQAVISDCIKMPF